MSRKSSPFPRLYRHDNGRQRTLRDHACMAMHMTKRFDFISCVFFLHSVAFGRHRLQLVLVSHVRDAGIPNSGRESVYSSCKSYPKEKAICKTPF